jgi:hypothetical protein
VHRHVNEFCISSFRGSHDGDFCAVDVKKMDVSHWSKKVHLGSPVSSIEFCPTERYWNSVKMACLSHLESYGFLVCCTLLLY